MWNPCCFFDDYLFSVVGIGHVQASAGEQLALLFGLDGHFAPNDGVDAISWLDVLVTGIYVFIIVSSLRCSPASLGLSDVSEAY